MTTWSNSGILSTLCLNCCHSAIVEGRHEAAERWRRLLCSFCLCIGECMINNASHWPVVSMYGPRRLEGFELKYKEFGLGLSFLHCGKWGETKGYVGSVVSLKLTYPCQDSRITFIRYFTLYHIVLYDHNDILHDWHQEKILHNCTISLLIAEEGLMLYFNQTERKHKHFLVEWRCVDFLSFEKPNQRVSWGVSVGQYYWQSNVFSLRNTQY